ncbi:alpha/beta hydrolase [Nocardia sp. BMG111209]|uniref:alpha/beta hydrolase n=1 Tax=Nocardia sp. BMG111209 TaxID=1160137 RepID=UPI00036497D6|nr:alpha/beta fold hydrolase [Nocardia sp. BMG111209]
MPRSFTFPSDGIDCHAWHFPAADDRFATAAGRPAVVMAHGFAATKDCGLESFARPLADGGLDVIAFDYRGFGSSGGERQIVSPAGQIDDYRAALRAAAQLPGIDRERLVLWGVSMAGGTVLAVAAGRTDLVATIALTPLVTSLSREQQPTLPADPRTSDTAGRRGSTTARLLMHAARDKYAARAHKRRVMLPAVGRPDEVALLNLPGVYDDYLSIVGPTWRNEVNAASALDMLGHRPIRFAQQIPCPALFQIADHDRCVPVDAAMKAGVRARAQIRHYRCDHFNVYPGKPWHDAVRDHQMRFLTNVLSRGDRATR